MHPIRPSWIYATTFHIPTIEEALFGFYAVRGKRLHKSIASCVFQQDVTQSLEMFNTLFNSPHFDAMTVVRIVRSRFCQVHEYLDEPDENRRRFIRLCTKLGHGTTLATTKYEYLLDREGVAEMPTLWTPTAGGLDQPATHRIILTVWLRINVAAALGPEDAKVTRFIDAHLPLVRFLDHLQDARDSVLDLKALNQLYQRLGPSRYDEDRNFVQMERTRYKARPSLLETLHKHFPSRPWALEDMVHHLERSAPAEQVKLVQAVRQAGYDLWPTDDWVNNKLYYAALIIMVQCKELHAMSKNGEVRDALWYYHGCFLDFVYNCGGMSDTKLRTPKLNHSRTLMELYYPHENRCFTAYDLPDVFHVIMTIPLLAEHTGDTFKLWKFIQKSLPYCCAGRTLIGHTVDYVNVDEAFWNVFSAVFYCLLMDMYPWDMSSEGRKFDLRYLMDAKRLTSSKELMVEALGRLQFKQGMTSDAFRKENDKGSHIVYTAFRLWVVMMVRGQRHYIDFAGQFINWNDFCKQTFAMADTIRSCALWSKDPFEHARTILHKTNETQVYRYRKGNIVRLILDLLKDKLEKHLFRHHWYQPMTAQTKENILNLFIRMPQEQWLTPLGLSVLKLDEYGAVTHEGILIMLSLMDIYYDDWAKPKELRLKVDELDTNDLQVFTWFFNIICILQTIQFQPLTRDQVHSIDYALKHVHHMLYVGQQLPRHAYSVFITICCNEIRTSKGPKDFGQAGVAYDMVTNRFVCIKGQKKIALHGDLTDVGFETETKKNRDQRKRFNYIPCKNTPVLDVNLEGFCLIYDGKKRYMHCPKCGAFHEYHVSGWSGSEDGRYRCPDCIQRKMYHTCAICGDRVTGMSGILDVVDPVAPNGVTDIFQRLYFCKTHYAVGRGEMWGLPKRLLFQTISKRTSKIV